MNTNGTLTKKKKVEIIDVIDSIDILRDIKDPQSFPWKYKDKSVKEITCVGVLEYLPGKLRGKFMDEIHRILADDGKCSIVVPNWNSDMAYHDYMYEFPPLCPQSFLMFNKEWRDVNKKNVDITCSFDFTYGYTFDPETNSRNDESKTFHAKHYSNAIQFIHLMLTKRH